MNEERLNDVLSRWQEQQLQGRDPPAAELCADCPELAEELSKRIGVLRRMNGLAQPGGAPANPDPDTRTSPGQPVLPGDVETLVSPDEWRPAAAPLPEAVPGYEILGELGRGGMGVVYKARQVALNRLVALKMVLAGGHAGAVARARFRREAEAAARLQHPNIVPIYEIGEAAGRPFFSLEYVEGGSLDQKSGGAPLPARSAAELVEGLARAIHHAHQAGIVHRDLKPANVLLSADGTPKVSDFGLAKLLEEQGPTLSGDILGTPSYMAPEQAAGKKDIGPASDVYALGAILYELLTGRPPFRGEDHLETLAQVCSQEPVPPRDLQPKVPRDLETICCKCLQKRVAARYATALELAEDLQRFLRHEPIRARPVTALEKLWRWARRHPVPAGLLAAGLLAPLVALVALSLLSTRLVRSSALESAAQQAELLEQANNEYSRIVQRVEQAHFKVNKSVPPTPGTVPLSIPATFLHDVGEQLRQSSRTGVQVRQYSDYPFPWRRGGPRDDFEREALQRLRQSKGQETVHEFTVLDGRRVVRYAQARLMQVSCVKCHNEHPRSPRKDWQVGDVRGVLEIIRPLDQDEARVGAALRLALLLSAAASGLLLAGSLLMLWVSRRGAPGGL
jgi:serine/threonine protein kinase